MTNRRGRFALRPPTAAAAAAAAATAAPAAPADWLRAQSYRTQPLLDVRAAPRPPLAHSTQFAGVHDLAARAHELPPPSARAAAALVADGPVAAADAAAMLAALGFGPIVAATLDDVRSHAPELLADFAGGVASGAADGSGDVFRSRALWSPSPSVVELLPHVAAATHARTALDVGCGSGRDAAYLAAHGWDVLAIDRCCGLVDKAEALGARHWAGLGAGAGGRRGAVVGAVRTLGADLRADACWLRENAAALLVVVRFLRRGVLELLPNAVADGGWVIVEHFLTGCEKLGGPVKRSQMLERGELGRLFGPAGFTILCEEEVLLDDGRPVARFLAVRQSSVT